MSHHLDTPLARQNGQLYIDDLYVFDGNDSTVFVMDVNSTITEPHVQPGFHHEARYEFKVHFDGAEFEDLTYRVSFGEPDADGRQSLQLHALTGDDARDDFATGDLVLEGRTGEPASDGSTRLWAGRIADSFYIDLSLLVMINAAVQGRDRAGPLRVASGGRARTASPTPPSNRSCWRSPTTTRCCGPAPEIGVWCATKLATDAGGWRQINRAGHPMMWPIFWPDDTQFANPANTRHPSEDFDAAGQYIADQIAAVVAASGTSDDPQGYGERVARELFPDVLPYVVGTPATYGFAGFNGRTLADNAPEVMLSLVTGTAVPFGAQAARRRAAAQRRVPLRRRRPAARRGPRVVGPTTSPTGARRPTAAAPPAGPMNHETT